MFPFSASPRAVFEPPTLSERILSTPLQYLITLCYHTLTFLRSSPSPSKDRPVRVVCMSDTHTLNDLIPHGDILIHAGDLTNEGSVKELQEQIDWLDSLPHKYKIAIAGNHDTYLDPRARLHLTDEQRAGHLDWKGIKYLQHDSVTLDFPSRKELGGVRRLKIYGAPQIPKCGPDNFAFQYAKGLDAWRDTIPPDTDVLVTHTPPKFYMDNYHPWLGCPNLLKEVWRVKPALHVFGHIHVGAGMEVVYWDEVQKGYESGMERDISRRFFRGILDVTGWTLLGKVVIYGISGVVWDRIWGGEGKSTVLVNAALTVNNTGTLGNKVQVIDL